MHTAHTLSSAPTASAQFARAYWITMRPYLLFVSGITGVVGMATGAPMSPAGALALAAAAFFAYGFGQALTDVFQTDTDRISSPYRPLVRGEIGRSQVIAVSMIGLTVVGAVFVGLRPMNVVLVVGSIAGLAAYTWFKRRWWGGPFWNAAIVLMLFMIGFAGTGAPLQFDPSTIATAIVVFFGYANFVLAGYFKDIEADRATGYHTFPVVFGRAAAAIVSDVFASIAVCAAAWELLERMSAVALSPIQFVTIALVAGGIVTSIIAQAQLHRVRRDDASHRPIALVVYAYILLLAAIASALHPDWTLALVAFAIAFHLTLRARPMAAQI